MNEGPMIEPEVLSLVARLFVENKARVEVWCIDDRKIILVHSDSKMPDRESLSIAFKASSVTKSPYNKRRLTGIKTELPEALKQLKLYPQNNSYGPPPPKRGKYH